MSTTLDACALVRAAHDQRGFAAALGLVLLSVSIVLVIGYNHVLGRLSGQRDLQ